jgi:glycosyltransferase involved in cell wall biosynthesis
MQISCVIVSYNNGKLLEEAVMSVVRQTRPPDEIIVADDASTDGSRQLIESLAHKHPNITPVFRQKNLGVSANRDLAMREARGDLLTWLDGDDFFLPTKIEAEATALQQRRGVIAYSDVRLIDRKTNVIRTVAIPEFAQMEASGRLRWLLRRTRQSPAAMLVPRDVHVGVGGYSHRLRTYEDWDYILRLAARPLRWVHSGVEGLVHHPGGGLSRQPSIAHMRDELRVLFLNRALAYRHVGLPLLLAVTGRTVAVRSKWGIVNRYWHLRGWVK